MDCVCMGVGVGGGGGGQVVCVYGVCVVCVCGVYVYGMCVHVWLCGVYENKKKRSYISVF